MKCYICEKDSLKKKKAPYSLFGVKIGDFNAEVCNKCKEAFFDEKTSEKISGIVKEKGLWGLAYKTKIGQAGTTLDIRLNKKIIEFMKIKKGEEVTIYPETKNKLVIET